MIFTTERFFEVAIESWPDWDSNSRPLILFSRSNRLRYQTMSSPRIQRQLCITNPIYSFVQCQVSSVATFALIKIFLR